MEQVNGLKTLVVKSPTRTLEIDSKFISIKDVKNHIALELKTNNCQVLHGKRKLNDEEQIIEIFLNFSSEEEKSKKCLYLNLITLEPKEITVSFDCPNSCFNYRRSRKNDIRYDWMWRLIASTPMA